MFQETQYALGAYKVPYKNFPQNGLGSCCGALAGSALGGCCPFGLGYSVSDKDYSGILNQQIVNAESLGYAIGPGDYMIGETISSPDDTGSVVIGPAPKNAALGYWSPYGRAYKYSLGSCCSSCSKGASCSGGLGEVNPVAKIGALAAIPVLGYLAYRWWRK